jgi:hypothetical protein
VRGFWACLVLVASVAAAGAGPRELIADCAKATPPATSGLAALEAACPGLDQALTDAGLRALLAAQPQATLSPLTLTRIVPLVAAGSEPPAFAPDPANARRALADIGAASGADDWWERLKAWLRRLVEGDRESAGSSWFGRWLGRWMAKLTLPQALLESLFWVLIVAVIGLALAVVANEARALGLFGGRAGRAERRPAAAGPLPAAEALREDIDELPAAERPRRLLQLILAVLAASGRSRAPRSLTHRELTVRVARDTGDPDGCFGALAALAEEQLYGEAPVPALRSEPVVAEALALYGRLTADAGRAT